MTEHPLVVIGIGQDGPAGLSQEALAHIAQARVLAGGKRHLGFFPAWSEETLVIDADLQRVVQQLKAAYQRARTVVLASGDPLFYGIGRLLTEHFPPAALLFLPHVSAVQLAFARIKTSWHDAQVISLHGRPLQTLLPALYSGATKIAVFTDATNHPAAIGRFLLDQGMAHGTLWVCEELGGPQERVTQWTPQQILGHTFAPLNVTILLRQSTPSTVVRDTVPLLGLPEHSIAHRAGMITRREIRLLTLCALTLHPGEVFWDVGAGSGSVALEAARLSSELQVFAIDRSPDAIAQITHNVQAFTLANVQPVGGEAPEACAALPDPQAVFIGGSGGRLAAIIAAVTERLAAGGRLVINCITLEHLAQGWELLRRLPLHVDTTSVQLAHSKPLGTLHRLEAESPIFILRAQKL